eukprot:1159075-Pelagomonas_calceolata.AAC.2
MRGDSAPAALRKANNEHRQSITGAVSRPNSGGCCPKAYNPHHASQGASSFGALKARTLLPFSSSQHFRHTQSSLAAAFGTSGTATPPLRSSQHFRHAHSCRLRCQQRYSTPAALSISGTPIHAGRVPATWSTAGKTPHPYPPAPAAAAAGSWHWPCCPSLSRPCRRPPQLWMPCSRLSPWQWGPRGAGACCRLSCLAHAQP